MKGEIVLFVNNLVRTTASDGYAGSLTREDRVRIEVVIPQTSLVFGITVDGKKNVRLKKNESEDPDRRVYRQNIEIKVGNDGVFHTEYPNNHLRLIVFTTKKTIELCEIAAVSQHGEFFLTTQITYTAECYQDEEGGLICPRFVESWPQLHEVFSSLAASQQAWTDGLAIASYRAESHPHESAQENLPGLHGKVLWWNMAQGLGAIQTAQGLARVHWKEVPKRPRFAFLEEGEIVGFTDFKKPESRKGRQTRFEREAVGVFFP